VDGPKLPSTSSVIALVRLGALTFGYALASWIGQRLAALPPGHISAVFPAAGLALAAVLAWGPHVWPAIWLGSLLGNSRTLLSTDLSLAGWVSCTAVGLGATLQAVLGAELFRRAAATDTPFTSARAAAGFIAIPAIGACLIGPTVGVVSLSLLGTVYGDDMGEFWLGLS
jgi:integral membrane sensor domain MASE1